MRRGLTFLACLAFMTSPPFEARAGSIPADVTLTVGPSVLDSIPSTYIVLIPDVNTTASFNVGGPLNEFSEPDLNSPETINIHTTFNVTITFEGPSGSHPSIDVTGNVTGDLDVTVIPSSSPFYAEGYNLTGSLYGAGTGTSATLQGWTPASGIPMSLIEPYLNPSIYIFGIEGRVGMGITYAPLYAGFGLSIDPVAASVPEPTTLLMYLAAIAGLGVRHGGRLRRSRTPIGRIDGDS